MRLRRILFTLLLSRHYIKWTTTLEWIDEFSCCCFTDIRVNVCPSYCVQLLWSKMNVRHFDVLTVKYTNHCVAFYLILFECPARKTDPCCIVSYCIASRSSYWIVLYFIVSYQYDVDNNSGDLCQSPVQGLAGQHSVAERVSTQHQEASHVLHMPRLWNHWT